MWLVKGRILEIRLRNVLVHTVLKREKVPRAIVKKIKTKGKSYLLLFGVLIGRFIITKK